MPVEIVVLETSHLIKQFLHGILALEISALVQHQRAPRACRIIRYGSLPYGELAALGLDSLTQCLDSIENADGFRSCDFDLLCSDFYLVSALSLHIH